MRSPATSARTPAGKPTIDCIPNAVSQCPAFDRLLGSRILVGNLEFRFPLLRPFGVSQRMYGPLPVEVLRMPSLEYVPDQGIDFMWIDSLEELRPAELSRFAAWATPRCVVGIHDTGPHKQLRSMIAELVQEGLLTSPLSLPTHPHFRAMPGFQGPWTNQEVRRPHLN